MSSRNHLLILSFLFVLIHSLLFWHYGIRVFYDSAAYLEAADYIIKNGELQDVHHLFYIVPISIMAVFRLLFPGEIIPIVLFQCILSLGATVLLYKSAAKVFNSPFAGLMTGLIFLFWMDNIHWNITTMTESVACSIFCLVVYRLSFWSDRPKDIILTAALMIVVFFTRPTSVVIIISVFAFVIAHYWNSLKERRAVLISVAVAATIAVVVSAERMLDHWNFSPQYLKGNVITFSDTIKDGPLYHESLSIGPPPSTDFAKSNSPIGRVVRFVYENPVHFFKAASLKIFYLVTFLRPYYSGQHNLYLVVWLLLVYWFAVLGWKTTTNVPLKLFVLASIVLNCGLIGISSVDWDNRFYIPMEPGIVLLAGGGAAMLVGRIWNVKKV